VRSLITSQIDGYRDLAVIAVSVRAPQDPHRVQTSPCRLPSKTLEHNAKIRILHAGELNFESGEPAITRVGFNIRPPPKRLKTRDLPPL
jgi:hypothetical protein